MSEETVKVMSKEEFEKLSPKNRGYVTYMAGSRPDQPNVPDEDNPYLDGTKEHKQWEAGAWEAYIETLDGVE